MAMHDGAKHTACRKGTKVKLIFFDGSTITGTFKERDGRGRIKLDVGIFTKDEIRRFIIV